MESENEAMEEGETRHTLKKRHHLGTCIEPILPCVPGLQRGPGNVQPFGGLSLGQPLGVQVVILLEKFGAPDALPALMTINLAPLLIIDDSAHSYLLTQPVSYWNCMG
jgi:hypothetical protein